MAASPRVRVRKRVAPPGRYRYLPSTNGGSAEGLCASECGAVEVCTGCCQAQVAAPPRACVRVKVAPTGCRQARVAAPSRVRMRESVSPSGCVGVVANNKRQLLPRVRVRVKVAPSRCLRVVVKHGWRLLPRSVCERGWRRRVIVEHE